MNFATTGYAGNNYFSFTLGTFQFGPKNFQTEYSTSSASGPWTSLGGAINFGSTGGVSAQNLLLPASTDNLANVWVRVVTTTAPTSTGGSYLDEITVLNNPPLNVSIASFGGSVVDQKVYLQWVMERTEDIASYTIERSVNGSEFVPVYDVTATDNRTYEFKDEELLQASVVYYRLRVNSTNGDSHHSQTVHFYLGKKTRNLAVAPNPVSNGVIEVQLSTGLHEGTVLSVTDMLGRTVATRQLTASDIEMGAASINISALAPGSYTVVLHDAAASRKETVLFVKN